MEIFLASNRALEPSKMDFPHFGPPITSNLGATNASSPKGEVIGVGLNKLPFNKSATSKQARIILENCGKWLNNSGGFLLNITSHFNQSFEGSIEIGIILIQMRLTP